MSTHGIRRCRVGLEDDGWRRGADRRDGHGTPQRLHDTGGQGPVCRDEQAGQNRRHRRRRLREDFTPVELLLTAIAGCSAVDVDFITSKRAEPTSFDVLAEGDKVSDENGNHMTGIEVTFTVRFPDEWGQQSPRHAPARHRDVHDRLCGLPDGPARHPSRHARQVIRPHPPRSEGGLAR